MNAVTSDMMNSPFHAVNEEEDTETRAIPFVSLLVPSSCNTMLSYLFVFVLLLAVSDTDISAFAPPYRRTTEAAASLFRTSSSSSIGRGQSKTTRTPTTREARAALALRRMAPRAQVDPRTPSDALLDLFNRQVTHELEASQLYLSASIWCDANDFPGMAKFFLAESNDERSHALSMVGFASKRGIPVRLSDVAAPDAAWETPEELWGDVLAAERANTNSLLLLGDEAAQCGDHVTTAFLMPYHMEQINAEDNLRTILAKVRDENKTPGLLRQLDSELGSQAKAHLAA